MKPPDDLLNWAAVSAKKRGLRPTMLALAARIAKARGMGLQTHAALPSEEVFAGIGLEPDATVPVDWIGQVYETLLAAKTRRARGVHFTPPEVAAEVAEATLEPLKGPLRIIDPAMGCGAFLLAAARFVARAPSPVSARATYFGFDTDPLAVELARLSLAIETGEPPESFVNLRVGDALLEAEGAFDAVIGNPPFGNAIEKRTARDAAYAAKLRALYPEFAQGAYDYSLLFFGLATRLLVPHGRYGLIGPTALLSDAKPWQQYMHEHFRPRALFLYPVNRFGAARIRTTAFIGAAGVCDKVEIRDHDADVRAPSVSEWVRSPGGPSWCETVRGAPRIAATQVLADFADVFAGCATGAAYELAPLVSERRGQSPAGTVPLITTGALDRYRCKWGEAPIRFLGRDFARPVWPDKGPRSVMAALARQQRPKILVGGLTSVIEAWFDERGSAAGVVSTWVIVPKAGVDAWALLALLNCATLSRVYMARHGAKSMSGRQTTIYKQALLELPMLEPVSDRSLAFAARLASELQGLKPGTRFDELDRELHLAAARGLGRSETEALEDFCWWCERTGNPQSGNLPSVC